MVRRTNEPKYRSAWWFFFTPTIYVHQVVTRFAFSLVKTGVSGLQIFSIAWYIVHKDYVGAFRIAQRSNVLLILLGKKQVYGLHFFCCCLVHAST
jgi:hypothetical protein